MIEQVKHRFAQWLRTMADRIDWYGAPKAMSFYFTIERRRGIVLNDQGRGCRLWYYGNSEYDKAHTQAENPL